MNGQYNFTLTTTSTIAGEYIQCVELRLYFWAVNPRDVKITLRHNTAA